MLWSIIHREERDFIERTVEGIAKKQRLDCYFES